MADELGVEHPVTIAARRAVSVSPDTISDLSASHSNTPREALEAIAHELSDRFHTAIAVDADVNAALTDDSREQLLRIAREALANACRHGGAKNVVVSVRQTRNGLVLRVCDDGCGIRGAGKAARPEGFGMRSMRERAAILDGDLTVHERRSGGTELQVTIP
jgi:signal transduction histidine kinase